MKKESFYTMVIILLLLLNFGALGFLFLHHGPPAHEPYGPPPEHGPDKLIIERLKLDGHQRDAFEQLKHEHHGQMMHIEEKSGKIHKQLFDLLKNGPIDTVLRNRLISQLQEDDRQKELVTFEHFRKLRGILRPDQIKYFDDFVQELSKYLLGPPPPPRR